MSSSSLSRKRSVFHAVQLFSLTAVAACASSAMAGTDPMAPGPFAVESKEYRLTPSVDADVLSDRSTEVWARVFFPKTLSGKLPLIGLLHGNHGTCGSGTNPRRDGSSEYTRSGTCPTGMVVTPNHEGYNYFAEHLASYGYIVFSINANRGITAAGGVAGDYGLNLARGRLVLKHLENWSKWATVGGAPATLGAPDLFKGHVDFDQVGLMGHSRGGEGVRAALVQYKDAGSIWPAKVPGLNIRAIFEIGAVDGQTDRTLDAPGAVWNQLLPMCDGDVSDLAGQNPFNRMMLDPSEPVGAQKSTTAVWGANHNFFNTEWQQSDSSGCQGHKAIFSSSSIESPEQKLVGKTLMTHFFMANVGTTGQKQLNALFNPAHSIRADLAGVTTIERDYTLSPSDQVSLRVTDFTGDSAQANETSSSPELKLTQESTADGTLPYIDMRWTTATGAAFMNVEFNEASGRDFAKASTLDFRLSLGGSGKRPTPLAMEVSIVDATGAVSSPVALTDFVSKTLSGTYNDVFQTVRMPVERFKGVDLSQVKAIRFTVPGGDAGKAYIAHVRFTVGTDLISGVANGEWDSLREAVENGNEGQVSNSSPRRVSFWKRLVNFVKNPAKALRRVRISRVAPRRVQGSVVAIRGAHERGSWQPSAFSGDLNRYASIELESREEFPIRDALPILKIGGEVIKLSDYPENHLGKIRFKIPEAQYERLRGREHSIELQYGNAPDQVWDFGKSTI